ncbi:hypothetical protein FHS55_002633 [Angulomicrobium tetraedrale]|uniref:Uncharacterized protein n=1 Tax=Ancylobacter tetraedralis TaxID=217068 RepID=A0A839ZBA0_9HYPH|nr:hypothetical protein [Ancylobacter tetraedralis]MBB3772024.1 hypothetical protein [Ancylobacter tetraedralis]
MARKQTTARPATFAAPTGRRVSNTNLAAPTRDGPPGAFVLRNFWPGADTCLLRRGSKRHATLGDGSLPVVKLMTYANGNNQHLFAATADAIYDVTTVADPMVGLSPVVSGFANGAWSWEQMMTSGGDVFLVCVNGADDMQIFDGTHWWGIDDKNIDKLTFNTKTGTFIVGATLTGATSGAHGTIVRVVGSGATGTIYVRGVTGGPFQAAETITGAGGGSAKADGAEQPYLIGITAGGTTPIATDQLAYVWSYQKRLFFIQKDSLKVWYLPIDQIGGAANVLQLGGEVPLGGALLFGSAWSLESSGSGGLSEQCAIVTTKGEVAVYAGNNPAGATSWQKVGTYRIGDPLGADAWIKAGGDLVIATTIGFIPLSQAVNRDMAVLAPAAVSYPIEPDWSRATMSMAFGWSCLTWTERQMVIVAPPPPSSGDPIFWVANARTGAWGEYTNWAAHCLGTFGGRLFFGTSDGQVIEANTGGSDQGAPYTGQIMPLYDTRRSSAAKKYPLQAKVTTRGPYKQARPSVSMMFDYSEKLPAVPSAVMVDAATLWGTAVWGDATWGADRVREVASHWSSVGGEGYAMTPLVQVTSGSDIPIDVEVIQVDLTYDLAGIVT